MKTRWLVLVLVATVLLAAAVAYAATEKAKEQENHQDNNQEKKDSKKDICDPKTDKDCKPDSKINCEKDCIKILENRMSCYYSRNGNISNCSSSFDTAATFSFDFKDGEKTVIKPFVYVNGEEFEPTQIFSKKT